MKITPTFKQKIILCLIALLFTALLGVGNVFAEETPTQSPFVSVKIRGDETVEKAFTSLDAAWDYATGLDKETLAGTNTEVKSDSRRTNYAEITLYDNCTTTKTLTVPAGVTVRIYMNGKTIAYEGTGSTDSETNPGSVFVVNGERNAPGALFLDGGIFPETSKVTGGKAVDKGGGICVNEYGELTLHDVTITGNVAQNKGGGVFLTSDGTGHGKMTVGGTVTIKDNHNSQKTSQNAGNNNLQLTGGPSDNLYISGEDKDPGMDIDGIYNDSNYPLAPDSRINVTHVPQEKIMRDPNREMMGCFKNEKENFVFRYKKFNNTDIEKAGDYIVMVPESPDPPEIKNVTFSTANGEDIESKGQPVIDKTNRTITVTLDTENDLKNLIAEISTTQEVMVRAKDDKPELLPPSRQDFELYAGCFAPADYSDPNGRKFILYGFDADSTNPDNDSQEWTVRVNATKRTITFDMMGGGALTDSFPDSIVVEKGKRFNDITDPYPKGGLPKTAGTDYVAFPAYVLQGWYFDKTLQRPVTGNEVINNSMTLYAKWYVREFPINYFMSGTPNNQENPAYFNVNSGNFTIKNPQGYENIINNGKLFIGWSYKDFHNQKVGIGNTLSPQIPSGSFINASTASLDYTPQYMTQQHNVVLDFGGAGEIENKNVMVEHGKSFDANSYIPQDQSLPTGVKWLKDIKNHVSDCNNSSITEDTTLYAAYTLTLDANGGKITDNSTKVSRFYAINDNYTSFLSDNASIPSRAGDNNSCYVFDGWYTAYTGGTKVTSGVMPSHEVTLYAHWLEVPVNTNNTNNTWETVRFETGGVDMPDGAHGIALKQDSTQIDASYFNFDAKPTRKGYTFDGWYAKDSDGNLTEPKVWNGDSGSQSLSLPAYTEGSKDLTLYAKWEQSQTQDQTVTIPVYHYVMQADGSFPKTGTKTEQSISLSDGPIAKIPLLDDAQLKEAFAITGSTSVNDVVVKPHIQSVRVDDNKVLPQEVNYYYIRKSFPYFYQYNGTPNGTPSNFIDTNKSTKNGYYPYGQTITIARNINGQLLHGRGFSHWEREVGTEVGGTNPNPTKISGTTQMPANLLSIKPVTLFYTFKLNTNLDGGKLENTAATANPKVKDNQITFTSTSQTFTMPTPTKAGYEFVGWQYNQPGDKPSVTANPLVIDAFTEIDNIRSGKPTTYTAVWKKDSKTLTVDFNLNGHGAPQPKSQTDLAPDSKLPYDCRVVIKNVKATGYNDEDDEVEWYKDSACTQKFVVDNDKVTENMTLYAKWTPQKYNVKLDMNGGSIANGQNSTFQYTIEDHAITLINPTWPGKTFAGWTGTGLDKPTVNVTIPTGSTGNRAYKANWTTGLYTVNFDTQGKGKAPADQKVLGDDNHLVQRPVNPTEKGYSFEGWFTDKGGTVPYSFNYPLKASQLTNGTLTLYAKWKPILYQLNLDANGGKFKDGSKEKTERRYINDDISIIYTADFTPTRENYLFMGWKTAKKTDKGEYFEDKTMPPQNLTLYADWYEIPFAEITFDTHGGTVVPTQYVRSGQKITNPSTPTLTGYTLEGWYTDDRYRRKWNFNDPVTESMTLHAKWDINYHKLTLDPNTGSFEDGTQVAKEKSPIHYGADLKDYVEPVNPPSGQKFIGWFSGNSMEEADQQYTAKDKMPDHDLILVAQYRDYRCIYFDAEGGTLQGDPLVEVKDGQPITPPTATRTGYTTDNNWYLDGETQPFDFNNIIWTEGETVKVLKAKWTPNPLTITLDANGGKFSDQSGTATHHAFYDDTAISFGNTNPKQSIYDPDKRPTKEGYYFVGWYTDKTEETDTYVDGSKSLTENTTYYAHWTPVPGIVVMFETNGGSPVSPQVLEGGNKATRPEQDPTKPGREFVNWYADKDFKNVFDFDTPITQNTTIYAKWNTVKYHINAYPNGGEIDISKETQGVTKTKENSYYKYEYTYDTPTFSVDNPTRNGYTFTGWTWTTDNRTRKSTTYTVPEGSTVNQNITATWKVNQYNIKYDLDGGKMNDGETNPATYTIETPNFTLIEPTKKGYNFTGWTGTGIDKDNPSTTVTIAKGSTGDRAYKANWTPIEYTITYNDLYDSTVNPANPETYTIESETIVLNNPTKAGYTFAGWTSNEFTGTMQKVTIPKGSTGAKSYTATWTPITYNITYDLDGGVLKNGTNPATYNIETEDITLINPTKKGYDFAGWTGTGLDSATQSVTITQGSIGDRSYKATWTPQKYTLKLNPNGGTFAEDMPEDESQTPTESSIITVNNVEYNTPLYGILPMDLKKEFNHFCGWKDNKGNLYTSNMKMPALDRNGEELTLTAQWNANRIIYFEINPDTDQGDLQQIPSSSGKAKRPENDPTRKHYTFTGWYADPDCIEKFDFNQTITDEFTVIYAGWIPKSYDINYNLDGGALPDGLDNPDDFTIEDYFTLNNPVKTGHTFTGWTGTNLTDKQQTVTIDGEEILRNKQEDDSCKLAYTAKWTVNKYKVTFNNMGKGTPPAQKDLYYDSTIKETDDLKLSTPGYTFEGWYKDENLTDKWNFATDTIPDHDITLYAKWSADKVAVKVKHQRMNLEGNYDNDDSSLIETEELKAYSDSIITPATKTYEGFTSPPEQTVSVDPSGNTVVTYQYERNLYILVLNDDENLVDYDSTVDIPTEVNVNPIIALMDILTNAPKTSATKTTTDTDLYFYGTQLQFNRVDNIPGEYKWYGWIMENEDGDWLKLSDKQNITMTMPAEDITVEPMVINGEFTITYDLAGGSLPQGKTNPDKYTYGSDEITLINPTRSGYIFTGWTGGGNAVPTKTVTINKGDFGDRHYTANWQRIAYTVTFDYNDERIAPQKVSVNDGAKVKEPEVPELDDRVFEYWMTKDGEPYDFNKPVYQNMTLYAKWTDIEPDPEPEKPTPTIYYRGHVQNIGWQTYHGSEWLDDTDTTAYIGTTGRALRLEAMEIAVPSGYTVTGFAHIQNRGDTEVEKLPDGITVDGEPYDVYRFGTTGKALRMEAIDFDILKDGKSITAPDGKGPMYRVHIQNGGWQGTVRGGSFAGTRGGSLRLEAMSFSVIR